MSNDVRDKIVYCFNTFYFDFLKALKQACPSLRDRIREHYKVASKTSDKYINQLAPVLGGSFVQDVVSADDIMTLANVTSIQLFEGIPVSEIKSVLSDVDTLRVLLYTLTGLVHLHQWVSDENADDADMLIEKFLQGIKGGDLDDVEDIIDDDIRNLVEKIWSIKSSQPDNATEAPPPSSSSSPEDMVSGTKLGRLAKEIAEEIDLSTLSSIKSPEDLFKVGDNNNVFGNVISKAGAKIFEKMQNGELRQDELLGEAFSFMNMMNKTGGKNAKGSPAAFAAQMMGDPNIMRMMASAGLKSPGKIRHNKHR